MIQSYARLPKRIHLSVPHVRDLELAYVQEAFLTGWLSTVGPNLEALERSFTAKVGLPSVALSSGTAGLHLGLKLIEVVSGDEVVVPTLTFVASCNPVLYEGGVPVLLDSERMSWNLDPELLSRFMADRARSNRLPKAVIVVHLFGQSAEVEAIVSTCNRYEIPIIEDAANSLGATYRGRLVGTFGQVGAFSFGGNKIVTATVGGMLVSPRKDWVEKARYWSTQARDPDPDGVNNYVHSEVGYNYRMSNVLAGIARGQLEVLPLRVEQRRAVFHRYREALAELPGLEPQPEAPYGLHTRWLSCFLVNEEEFGMSSNDLIRFLDAANIESRPVWRPMHMQPLYRKYECIGGAVAEDLNRRGICLPSSSNLTEVDQQFVIERIREAHERARPRNTVSGFKAVGTAP